MKGKLATEPFLQKTVNMFVSVPKLTWDTMVTVSVFGAELSGRVGEGNRGDEGLLGRYGVGRRRMEDGSGFCKKYGEDIFLEEGETLGDM